MELDRHLGAVAGCGRRLARWAAALGVAGTGLWQVASVAAPDPTREKVLYTVANAHLDTQWLWTIQKTINDYLPLTLTNNFQHFEQFPDYTFSFEGAFRYQLIREYYPEWYATLSNYIAQGRWRVAGSVVDAGDVNIPSPESLMRQILYGNGFWKREFGRTSTDIFLPDCFGFGYALPSIAAHCGLTGFSSQKLSWGSAIPVPFQNMGRWIGPDGRGVVAVLTPGAYVSTVDRDPASDEKYLTRINRMGTNTGLFLDYRYYGVGDTGGAPWTASVQLVQQAVNATNAPIRVLSAASDQLFRDLTPGHLSRLPEYRGELLMRIHGNGCYTSHSELKTWNRRNELWADAAERAAVMADWLQGGGTYPRERLTQAWVRFLWHQFHDDLTGTSIDAAYAFTWNDLLLSLKDFAAVEGQGIGVVAKALDTRVTGVPLVVFNPLATEREDVVEAEVAFPSGVPAAVRVYGPDGREVPSQAGSVRGQVLPVTFLARVPSVGVAVFEARPVAAPCELASGLSVTTSQLENPRYRVRLDANGDVASVFDKTHQRELLGAPVRWHFLPDRSQRWPAWEILYSDVTNAPAFLGGPATVEVEESGPARVTLAVTRFKDGSTFTERLRLAAGGAGDQVEWEVLANWNTRQRLLKVAFPLGVTNATATYDLGLGVIGRGNNRENLYEVPAQQWADLTQEGARYGVTILSDSKYGWDKPDDHTLRLTVFHTPKSDAIHYGTHRFVFGLAGHAGDWREGQSPWIAARLNQPLQAFQTAPHAGRLGRSVSFLSCDNPNVMVKAIKMAEDSDEIVVRLQELSGTAQNARLTGAAAITAARELTGAEEPLARLAPEPGRLAVTLGPFSPKTLALTLAPPPSIVARPESKPLSLPFNVDVVSDDANRTDGNFARGYSYPAELWPAAFLRDGVAFRLGSTKPGEGNAVACEGQTLELNAAGYDQLHLLAAADGDAAGDFVVDGQTTRLWVGDFTGFIGQWKPPLLKPDEVAWVCTHRHDPKGNNDAYRFCYLFQYRIALPPNARTLTLPRAPGIRVFAASLARNTGAETTVAGGALGTREPPWADAGESQRIRATGDAGVAVTLDGRRTLAGRGRIVAWDWSENGVVFAKGIQTVAHFTPGEHIVMLTVTDERGVKAQAGVKVVVIPPLAVTISATPSGRTAAPLTFQFQSRLSGGPAGADNAPRDLTDEESGLVTAQGDNGPVEGMRNAFDDNPQTKWLDFARGDVENRASWIQYQFRDGAQGRVSRYALTSANDVPARDPMAWTLLGSNDGGANWATLDARTNEFFKERFERRVFECADTNAWNLYRLQIHRVADGKRGGSVQLAELELIGQPRFQYRWDFGDGSTSTEPNPTHTFARGGRHRVTVEVSDGFMTATNSLTVPVDSP